MRSSSPGERCAPLARVGRSAGEPLRPVRLQPRQQRAPHQRLDARDRRARSELREGRDLPGREIERFARRGAGVRRRSLRAPGLEGQLLEVGCASGPADDAEREHVRVDHVEQILLRLAHQLRGRGTQLERQRRDQLPLRRGLDRRVHDLTGLHLRDLVAIEPEVREDGARFRQLCQRRSGNQPERCDGRSRGESQRAPRSSPELPHLPHRFLPSRFKSVRLRSARQGGEGPPQLAPGAPSRHTRSAERSPDSSVRRPRVSRSATGSRRRAASAARRAPRSAFILRRASGRRMSERGGRR